MSLLPHSSDTESIVGIRFGIFSPEDIRNRGVCEITSPATTEGKSGGLFDSRMGVLENGKICRSCGQNNHHCPGHFGYFELARPLYNTQFFKIVMKVLSCACYKCAKLLIDKTRHEELFKLKGEARWKKVHEACSKIKRCGEDTEDGCGSRQPTKYSEETIHRIIAEFKGLETVAGVARPEGMDESGNLKMPLEPEYVYRLLRRITDEDVEFMGFSRHYSRPDWMMCTVLPIPPPQVRPSVTQDNNQRSEDDLTSQLACIIKTNATLKAKIAADEPKKKAIDEWTNLLQYYVATLVDNNIPGVSPSAQRSGRQLKSLQQRLGSKEGRIRSNLQGKRVEFSARSVITPDPNISVKELGIPEKIATNLTFPEMVTPFNIGKLYKLVQNGPDVYPGAKTILKLNGRTISLKHVDTKKIELVMGDVVHRHLMDGDPVLFNRQPSLHRMSMMCHFAKILPYNTFRLNVFVTAPYNADFDGDEMNLHAPQSVEAATELRMIAAVPLQIVSPRESTPIVSVVQDTLVGANRFARPDVLFTRKEAMNLLVHAKRWDGRLPDPVTRSPQPLWSGQQLMSALLPPVSLKMKNSSQEQVTIFEGCIAEGLLDKSVFSKQLLHIIYNDHGPEVTIDFLDSLQKMIATFLMNSGFSVGISDLIADESTLTEMNEKVNKLTKSVEDQILQLHTGLFENSSGRSNSEEFESKVMGTLNRALGEAGGVGLKSLAATNRLTNMVKAGSKGSDLNVSQMIATLGQTSIDGKRVPNGFQHRSLPHNKRFDDSARARGFIASSYIKGLQPDEFFFHAMSGREGLIDTAVKSVTGDTPVVVMEKGVTKCVPIGDWIDAQLDGEAKPRVERFEERDMELLHLDEPVYIPTTDAKGVVTWGEITAITRHDPGLQLYEIVTSAGKRVIVTESKSLLIWDPATSTFERMSTPDVKPGHYVPVTLRLPEPPIERSDTSDYAQGVADSVLLRESCDAMIQTALVASLGKSSDYIAGFLVQIDSTNPAIVDAKNMLYSRLSITPKCYAGFVESI